MWPMLFKSGASNSERLHYLSLLRLFFTHDVPLIVLCIFFPRLETTMDKFLVYEFPLSFLNNKSNWTTSWATTKLNVSIEIDPWNKMIDVKSIRNTIFRGITHYFFFNWLVRISVSYVVRMWNPNWWNSSNWNCATKMTFF